MSIAEDTRRLCDEIVSSRSARREEIPERQRSVGEFLKEARDSQFRMGEELKNSLAQGERQRLDDALRFGSTLAAETRQRAEEVGQMLAGFARENSQRADAVRELLQGVRQDMQSAGAAWRELAAPFTHSSPPPTAKPVRGRNDKEKKILNVVMGHPRGLKLTEIGNMLGADWRSLNAPTRNLVATGKLRKVNNLYFCV